ncbi:MAG: type 4a pilus biogenesis protein PilO [Thermodesulfobacteriota bacterium]
MAIDIKGLPDLILKRPLYQRVLVLAVINIAIVGLVFSTLLGPKRLQATELTDELDILTIKLQENRRIASDIPRFQKEKEELEGKLKLALAQLPNEKEIPSLIDGISDAGNEAGLTLLLFQPSMEVLKDFYAEVPVDMEVSGRYESLFHFCEKVASLPRIVNIGSINVSVAKGSGNSRTPELSASFVATTFRFVSAGPSSPGPSPPGPPK